MGKKFVVFGVASEESIAWRIVLALKRSGHDVHIGYQQRFRSRILQLIKSAGISSDYVHRCDLLNLDEINGVVSAVGAQIDGVVHSVAYAPPSTFSKTVSMVEQVEFEQTLSASCFTLIQLVRALRPMLASDSSIVAMSYIGSQRVVPGYKVMGIAKAALESTIRELAAELGPSGIRVNAVSAGPIKTLSSMAVPNLSSLLENYKKIVPLRRCVSGDDVAGVAEFLLSGAAQCITGQTIYADAGFSAVALSEG